MVFADNYYQHNFQMLQSRREYNTVEDWELFAHPGSGRDLDLRGLADSARQSFAIVEHWKTKQTSYVRSHSPET